ncbi:MAG TPA: LuxR C-terminal-related transcriptional regulator, partial [Streptosporangiaceae bacterium]
PARHAERALAAALAHMQAGAFGTALSLLAQAEAEAVDDLQRARVEHLRGQIECRSVSGREAPVLLLQAARRLESLDAGLAREAYLSAWLASHIAGPLAGPGGFLPEVSRAARAAPRPPGNPQPGDLLLDAVTAMTLERPAAAEPAIRRALKAFLGDQVSGAERLQWGTLAQTATWAVWDYDSWLVLSSRDVEVARVSGALTPLSIFLSGHASAATMGGDFGTAASLVAERAVVNEVTGIQQSATCDLRLAAYRGRSAEAEPLYAAIIEDAEARGEGLAVHLANWAAAVLRNGQGRYAEALAAAESATGEACRSISTQLVLPELIEAAMRTGRADLARDALDRLSATALEGSDWAKGLEARSRALVSEDPEAEQCYAGAIQRLGRTLLRPELARAHLLYGEWLRRENRRLDARHQLNTAYSLFTDIGAEAFAERARRELLAAGEKARKREVDTQSQLTPQEKHIIRLARDGRTNAEIAAELFISTRTVEWHMRKVFAKLGITSRRDLHRTARPRGQHTPSG